MTATTHSACPFAPTADCEDAHERFRAIECELLQSTHRYERLIGTIPCALYDYVRWSDGSSRFLYISPQCEGIFEHSAEAIMSDPNLMWSMVDPADLERLQQEDLVANQNLTTFQSEVRANLPSGRRIWVQLTSRPGPESLDGQLVWSGVILDITARKEIEEERNRLVDQLQSALAEVKVLSGFLPICMSCKKIRDDQGYWNQLEAYISEHSDAEFSHGVCPDCSKRYLAEIKQERQRPKAAAVSR